MGNLFSNVNTFYFVISDTVHCCRIYCIVHSVPVTETIQIWRLVKKGNTSILLKTWCCTF